MFKCLSVCTYVRERLCKHACIIECSVHICASVLMYMYMSVSCAHVYVCLSVCVGLYVC